MFSVVSVFSVVSLSAQPSSAPATLPSFEIIGRLDAPAINESSGVVASRRFPGVFWTHNDSGNSATIFAITREGKLIASFTIAAPNVDWEDIAIDDAGHLYLADIGNNTANRSQVQIYRIPEPDPRGEPLNRAIPPERVWRLTYPDAPFDAEAVCVTGETGYVISKQRDVTGAGVYRFDLNASERPIELVKIATLSQRLPVTGADISPDRRWLAVMTVAGPGVYEIGGDMTRVGKGQSIQMLFLDPAAESVCFVPGGLLATTEGRRVVFFPVVFEPVLRPGRQGN